MSIFHAILYISCDGVQNTSNTSHTNVQEKKSYKEHINNLKPKKCKHKSTFEESFRASLLKDFERKIYEQEKIFQQTEYEFEIKKRDKDNIANIIRQSLNRADRDLFLQV